MIGFEPSAALRAMLTSEIVAGKDCFAPKSVFEASAIFLTRCDLPSIALFAFSVHVVVVLLGVIAVVV